jgi:hypothetical protein
MFEQLILDKEFEENPILKLGTKTQKSNKGSRGRHVVAFSLCFVAGAVAPSVRP